MKTLIKLLMWLVLAVVVVVGAAIVLIPMLVDPQENLGCEGVDPGLHEGLDVATSE